MKTRIPRQNDGTSAAARAAPPADTASRANASARVKAKIGAERWGKLNTEFALQIAISAMCVEGTRAIGEIDAALAALAKTLAMKTLRRRAGQANAGVPDCYPDPHTPEDIAGLADDLGAMIAAFDRARACTTKGAEAPVPPRGVNLHLRGTRLAVATRSVLLSVCRALDPKLPNSPAFWARLEIDLGNAGACHSAAEWRTAQKEWSRLLLGGHAKAK